MAELKRVHLRGAPVHAAIGRAFDEMDARDLREAQDVLHGQQQRRLTSPWIMSLCCAGSMSGRPAW